MRHTLDPEGVAPAEVVGQSMSASLFIPGCAGVLSTSLNFFNFSSSSRCFSCKSLQVSESFFLLKFTKKNVLFPLPLLLFYIVSPIPSVFVHFLFSAPGSIPRQLPYRIHNRTVILPDSYKQSNNSHDKYTNTQPKKMSKAA